MAYATSTYLAIMAVATAAVGTGTTIYSQQQQAKSEEEAAKHNNKLAEAEAKNREKEAGEQMKRQQIEKRKEMGRLRNALSAQNTHTSSGTPLSIIGEASANMSLSIADAARASGMQAAAYRSQGQMGLWEAGQSRRAANINSVATGIEGLGSAASGYYGFKK